MHLVQILERLGGNALLIIGFGKVEVSFCQAEERELEPDARSGLIVKFDRRGAPLTASMAAGKLVFLPAFDT